jgi:hypothetical protein
MCTALCVVVYLKRGEQALDAYADHLHDLARDTRGVGMRNNCALEAWQMGTHVGIDYGLARRGCCETAVGRNKWCVLCLLVQTSYGLRSG